MNFRLMIVSLLILILACQVIPSTPVLQKPTFPARLTPPPSNFIPTITPAQISGSEIPPENVQEILSPGILPPFPTSAWLAPPPDSPLPEIPSSLQEAGFALPASLKDVLNLDVAAGLTNNQRAELGRVGFLVIASGDAQFSDIRNQVSLYNGQPYFLTSDAAFHAYHLSFSELITALEKEELYPRLTRVTRDVLDEMLTYLPVIQDETLLKDARLAVAFVAVGMKLLDPQSALKLDDATAAQVQAQYNQVVSAQGFQPSILNPNFVDDFSLYHPSGRYANEPALENYFRGITWYRRFLFKLVDADPRFVPSKAPLIITMALRRAKANSGEDSALDNWMMVNDTLAFLLGPGEDYGPRQYAAMMDAVYGPQASILALSEEFDWLTFQGLNQTIPYSQVEFPFGQFLVEMNRAKVWKFVNSRFLIDEIILNSLVYDRVGTPSFPRQVPSGLDIMAALGSPAAIEALQTSGTMGLHNYAPQLERVTATIRDQPAPFWGSSIFHAWLNQTRSQLASKSGGYPHFMQSMKWDYKEMNTALGIWVGLRHDTPVVSRNPELGRRLTLPASPPAPAFVEPNPGFFFHLANQAEWVVSGLKRLGMDGGQSQAPFNLSESISDLNELAIQFHKLGDIAKKELNGEKPGLDDYRIIQAPLGPIESRALSGFSPGVQVISQPQELPAIPMITALPVNSDLQLQIGTGKLNRIFVIVPLGGHLQIAQGGVFSYYEFPQSTEEVFSDGRWQRSLTNPVTAFEPPDWTARLVSQDSGFPVEVMVFRVGDIYRIAPAGGDLNIRAAPAIGSQVLLQLNIGEYVEIVDGPVNAQGYTWWKLRTDPMGENHLEGWAVENPSWYQRVWGN